MQDHIYLAHTYAYEVQTEVLKHTRIGNGLRIALAENIFHPQGGGQPSDRGWVDGVPAAPLRDADSGWVYLDLLPEGDAGEFALTEGQLITAAIDAEQRRRCAALHSAGHLVDALVRPWGVRHVGNNHFPGEARIEYALDGVAVDKEQLADSLRERLEETIAKGLPISSGEQNGRRTITIEGLATEFCAGTHVTDLSCLADVSIRSIKVKSGRLRVGYEAAHAPLA